MGRRYCRVIAGLAVGIALAVAGGPTWAADLLQIYHRAQASDPTFEAARYALDAAREKLPQARAGLLPSVTLSGTDNRTHAATSYNSLPIEMQHVYTWNWTVQLTQPLVRLQNYYAYTESESLVAQAEAQFAQAEQELILNVAQAYFDVLAAQDGIAAAQAQVEAMHEQWAQAKRGFETGVTAITDVHEARSKLDQARSQRVAAQNDLEVKRSELDKLVGQAPTDLAVLAPHEVVPRPQPDDPTAWIARARATNPAVVAQQAAYKAAETEVSRNRAQYAPTLDAVVSYGRNYSSGNLTLPEDYSTRARSRVAGVQLTVPIFSGGETTSKVAEAIANRYKARAELEETRRKAAAEARQAYAGIMSGLSQIEALESAVASGESSVKGNRIGYRSGIRINSDVLGAEQQLYSSRRDLAKARYDTLLQGLKLKAAAGSLTESDLATINALLVEPQAAGAR